MRMQEHTGPEKGQRRPGVGGPSLCHYNYAQKLLALGQLLHAAEVCGLRKRSATRAVMLHVFVHLY